MDSGIQVAAMIVIASFVIDRVTGGAFFVLSLFDGWNRIFPDPVHCRGPRATNSRRRSAPRSSTTYSSRYWRSSSSTHSIFGVLEGAQLDGLSHVGPNLQRTGPDGRFRSGSSAAKGATRGQVARDDHEKPADRSDRKINLRRSRRPDPTAKVKSACASWNSRLRG